MDETKLKGQFGVMVVGMVFEGRCILLAWRVYRANCHADYPAEGQARMIIRLLKQVRAGLPQGTSVRVLAGSGYYTSLLLLRGISALGLTFLVRVTKQSKIRPRGWHGSHLLRAGAATSTRVLCQWTGIQETGTHPGSCPALWRQDAYERWALVTNDPQLTVNTPACGLKKHFGI
ncbi:MAG: hypothetical protein U0521_18835 [Anaerolineae bacterium]